MRRIIAGDCDAESVFDLVDPTRFLEVEFEAEVVRAFSCLEPDYWCGVFAGAFILEGERHCADLALIRKNLSHWFVVEVELAGHSLEGHVLPQVRCFRYGEPDQSCAASLLRSFSVISSDQARALLTYVPRHVVVVGNLPNQDWTTALLALDTQHLTLSVYKDLAGRTAHELEGRLIAKTESLGFARYSEVDRCLRLPVSCGLPVGQVQLIDQFGNPTVWTSRASDGVLWISKQRGPALLQHGAYVQLLRTRDGQIVLRPATV